MEFWGESRYLTPLSLSEIGEQLSQSDSSESVINSARDNVNSTINPDLGLEITNDTITGGREKSNYMKRCRKHKIDSLTMEAVEKFFGKPIDEAAASLAGNTSTLKRFCREHGLLSWPLPKHNKRTVDVTDSKLSRISKSSQNLQLSLDSPFGLFGAVLLLSLVTPFCYFLVVNNLGVGTGKLRCILQWWSDTKIPKLIQAPVVTSTSEEAPASVVAAQFKETMREQFIENATKSTVKILTIKATYNENMVKFPFTLLDGLEKL
nr:hypothetical protein [Tanacetum cinerariifolium]